MPQAIPFSKVTHRYWTGTTSATADETTPIKNVLSDADAVNYYNYPILWGEDTYIEGASMGRDGFNFTESSVTELDTSQAQEARIVRLTDSLFVAITCVANTSLEAIAISKSGNVLTAGTAVHVNTDAAVDTDSVDICRVNNTTFAVAYRDEAGDDYVCARAGTVSGTTITMGTEKVLTSAAGTEDELSICYIEDSDCVVVAYADSADDLATIACPLSGTTFGTAGSIVEFDAAAPDWITACQIAPGYVFVAYSDGGDSNKLHARVASVSSAGAIGTPGTEKTFVDAAGTFLKAVYAKMNTVVVGYEDASNDPAVVVCTVASGGTTITSGTAVTAEATTAVDVSVDVFDGEHGALIWTDDAHGSDVGEICHFTLSGTGSRTVTFDSTVDKFVDTSAKSGTLRVSDIACTKGGKKVVIIYNDADNDLASYAGSYYENRIIDVRSGAASAAYKLVTIPEINKIETEAKV